MRLSKLNTSLIVIAVICTFILGLNADYETPEKLSVHVNGEPQTVTGELSGFDCAVVGELCPTTHRGADYTTGVFTEDEDFYFIVNIPQSFLQQYFRETVEVEGTMYDNYTHAVEPEKIHLIDEGESRLVYESGYFIDEDGNRATFQDGELRDGRWSVNSQD